ALIVAKDDDRIGRSLLEFLSEYFHRTAALLKTIAADFDGYLIGEPGRTQLHQFFEVVSLAAKPMFLIFAIGFRAQIPLFRRRRQQGPVRRSYTQYDFGHI